MPTECYSIHTYPYQHPVLFPVIIHWIDVHSNIKSFKPDITMHDSTVVDHSACEHDVAVFNLPICKYNVAIVDLSVCDSNAAIVRLHMCTFRGTLQLPTG